MKYDWSYTVYGNDQEIIPNNCPKPLGKSVTTTTTLDANLLHCLATGPLLTACLHFCNQTPTDGYSKKQATVETATYESEFAAAKTATEQIMNLRYTLRYLGVQIKSKSYIDRILSTTPGAEPPRDARDSGSARSHSTHLETSSSNRP